MAPPHNAASASQSVDAYRLRRLLIASRPFSNATSMKANLSVAEARTALLTLKGEITSSTGLVSFLGVTTLSG